MFNFTARAVFKEKIILFLRLIAPNSGAHARVVRRPPRSPKFYLFWYDVLAVVSPAVHSILSSFFSKDTMTTAKDREFLSKTELIRRQNVSVKNRSSFSVMFQ